MKFLNYLADMPRFFKETNKQAWFDSLMFLVLAFLMLILMLIMLPYKDNYGWRLTFVVPIIIICMLAALRGLLGVIFFTHLAIKEFFPIKVLGVSYFFIHVDVGIDTGICSEKKSGRRIYWVQHFLNKAKALHFIATQNHLGLMQDLSTEKLLYVWDGNID